MDKLEKASTKYIQALMDAGYLPLKPNNFLEGDHQVFSNKWGRHRYKIVITEIEPIQPDN